MLSAARLEEIEKLTNSVAPNAQPGLGQFSFPCEMPYYAVEFMDPAQQAEAAAQPVAPQFTAQPEVAQQVQAPAVAQAGIAAQQVDAEMSQA
ncbi:hypothetical protein KSW81_000778 [Nannochloris sp. 'desiccata']|nr:hypothetical protein KSW81_000778 [Chlorella desiccata (nom. nud.)]